MPPPQVYIATHPKEVRSGDFYLDSEPRTPMAMARDAGLGAELWRLSEAFIAKFAPKK